MRSAFSGGFVVLEGDNEVHEWVCERVCISKVSDGVDDSPFDPELMRGDGWLGRPNDVMWKAMLVVGGRNKVTTIVNENIE